MQKNGFSTRPVALGRNALMVTAALITGVASGQVCDSLNTSPNAVERPLYVIAGQSNAAGLASVDDSSDPSVPDLVPAGKTYNNVQIYGIYGAPIGVANNDNGPNSIGVNWSNFASWGVVRPGYGFKDINYYRTLTPPPPAGATDQQIAQKLFGPELYMAHFLNSAPGPQFIVKLGVAGTSLIPQAGIDNWAPNGHLYTELLEMITNAYNSKKSTYRLRVAGVFFMQGESDSLNESMTLEALEVQYKEALKSFISSLRNDLYNRNCASTRNTPFVIGRIQDQPIWKRNSQIRRAQQAVDRDSTANIDSTTVGLANTDDFLEPSPSPKGMLSDGVHFNEYGQANLGARAFHALMAPYGAGDFKFRMQGSSASTPQNFYTNGAAYCCYNKIGSSPLQNYLPVGFIWQGICGGYSCTAY